LRPDVYGQGEDMNTGNDNMIVNANNGSNRIIDGGMSGFGGTIITTY
jgi:hypothetical protein